MAKKRLLFAFPNSRKDQTKVTEYRLVVAGGWGDREVTDCKGERGVLLGMTEMNYTDCGGGYTNGRVG